MSSAQGVARSAQPSLAVRVTVAFVPSSLSEDSERKKTVRARPPHRSLPPTCCCWSARCRACLRSNIEVRARTSLRCARCAARSLTRARGVSRFCGDEIVSVSHFLRCRWIGPTVDDACDAARGRAVLACARGAGGENGDVTRVENVLGVGVNSTRSFPPFFSGRCERKCAFFFRNDQHSPFTRPFRVDADKN